MSDRHDFTGDPLGWFAHMAEEMNRMLDTARRNRDADLPAPARGEMRRWAAKEIRDAFYEGARMLSGRSEQDIDEEIDLVWQDSDAANEARRLDRKGVDDYNAAMLRPARGEMRRGWVSGAHSREGMIVLAEPSALIRPREIEWRYISEHAPPAEEPVEPCVCGEKPARREHGDDYQVECKCGRSGPLHYDWRIAEREWNALMRSARGGKA